jgi:hypothetical protein
MIRDRQHLSREKPGDDMTARLVPLLTLRRLRGGKGGGGIYMTDIARIEDFYTRARSP